MEPIDLTWLQFVPVAALVSASVTLLIRHADKPRPVIVLESQLEQREHSYSAERAGDFEVGVIAITNAGDGDAYDFEMYGHLCEAAFEGERLAPGLAPNWAQRRPVLKAGETVLARVLFPTSVVAGDPSAKLVIRWTPWPGRWWTAATRRSREVSLSEFDSAMPLPVGMIEPTELPRVFRRWRRLALHTERGRQRTAAVQRAQAAEAERRTPEQ